MKVPVRIGIGIALLTTQLAFAQSGTGEQAAGTAARNSRDTLPQFEVATIKPIDPSKGTMIGANVLPGARVVINGMPLRGLLMIAFRLEPWQIKGGESWIDRTRYDVVALPPEDVRAHITNLRHELVGIDDPTLRQMLQALLIDRFQLQYHTETRTGPVFLLETSGKKLGLRPTKAKPAGADGQSSPYPSGELGTIGGHWSIYDSSMPEFAKMAGLFLQRPVLDRTGLKGSFDYKSPVQSDMTSVVNDPRISLLQFISEMGLKLVSAKGPVQTFVIDHAERPSPN